MALKTQPTDVSVHAFIDSVEDEARREDCRTVLALMESAVAAKPKMWGSSIVGLGSYQYRYASGREGDWFLMGFSPRKRDLTLYLPGVFEQHADILSRLGRFGRGKSCLYLKRLSDVDLTVLEELIDTAAKHVPATAVVAEDPA